MIFGTLSRKIRPYQHFFHWYKCASLLPFPDVNACFVAEVVECLDIRYNTGIGIRDDEGKQCLHQLEPRAYQRFHF